MMVSNYPRCQIVRGVKLSSLHGRCQIVLFCMRVSNCPRCQIVLLAWSVSNCPRCQIVLGVKLSHHPLDDLVFRTMTIGTIGTQIVTFRRLFLAQKVKTVC